MKSKFKGERDNKHCSKRRFQ